MTLLSNIFFFLNIEKLLYKHKKKSKKIKKKRSKSTKLRKEKTIIRISNTIDFLGKKFQQQKNILLCFHRTFHMKSPLYVCAIAKHPLPGVLETSGRRRVYC